ncbi:hypothetical protein [Sphingomonas jatrophae]|uniref:Autotransporter domain-containing protein n=1 Tax=Sphingomonas jatrophae TaxID=1166337 RepID=A0A1I6JN30_9SPHN|nr:hypothetical protein [Sphingomonas jatrophae]SFR80375.1 hypothetical protein SAMN05192580_0566 [Sphingomonas jatrophae]
MARKLNIRRPLLAGCAPLALALAAMGQPAVAQSYLGNVTGTVNASVSTAANRTTVTVTGTKAIVDWTATGPTTDNAVTWNGAGGPVRQNTVTFQEAGTETVFQGPGQDYTVLNRINPGADGRAVVLNGVTSSYLRGEGGPRGGAVWFYSPGGIVIGPNGRFDVGSLLLTANRPNFDPATPGAGTISLGAPEIAGASVTVQPGAQINLSEAGSYLAMVAPRVRMGGSATVNGSVAYVAADAADITINGGLFDIDVSQGTSATGSDAVLEHSGSTTGPAGTNRGIFMVAVPRNDAVTMLVSGTAGYAAATDTSVQNGIVVLSAGSGAQLVEQSGGVAARFDTPSSPLGASIAMRAGTFSSDVSANASGGVIARAGDDAASTSDTLRFDRTVELRAAQSIALSAEDGASLTVGRALTLTRPGDQSDGARDLALRIDATGGGVVSIGGATRMDASTSVSPTALVHVGAQSGGRVTLGGGLVADASVSGTSSVTGGRAEIVATGGSVAITGGTTRITVNGSADGTGNAATGGTAVLSATDGSIRIGQSLDIQAQGSSSAGAGTGGQIDLAVGGTGTLPDGVTRELALPSAYLSAYGYGGGGATGTGGTITLAAASGTLSAGSLTAEAIGQGGGGTSARGSGAVGGTGGTGFGGRVSVTGTGGTLDFDSLNLSVDAFGGSGGDIESGYGNGIGGVGGSATAGTTLIDVAAGALTADALSQSAYGRGGFGGYGGYDGETGVTGTAGNGGNGTGGQTSLRIGSGGSMNVTGAYGSLDLSAAGQGGNAGYSYPDPAVAGVGQGGRTLLTVEDGGQLTATTLRIGADAYSSFDGGEGGLPASVGGGSAQMLVQGGGRADIGALTVSAQALSGGPRRGGSAGVTVAGGTLTIANSLSIDADAGEFDPAVPMFAPRAAPPATGPQDAQGGDARLTVGPDSSFTVAPDATFALSADAASTGNGDTSGNAVGGTAVLRFDGVTQALPAGLTVSARARSEAATTPGGAYGGTARLELAGGATLTVPGATSILADAVSGSGAVAALAQGGTAEVLADGGTLIAQAPLLIAARGTGGEALGGGAASAGQGGTAALTLRNGGEVRAPSLTISAAGVGGASLATSDTPERGISGDGTGGTVRLDADSGRIEVAGATLLDADGRGGANATAGTAGAGIGGTVSLTTGAAALALAQTDIFARGIGGSITANAYGAGGIGGDGRGGTISSAVGAGGMTATAITLDARGLGAVGGAATPGTPGGPYDAGAGGNATGGSASLLTEGVVSAQSLIVLAGANGGDGGANSAGGRVGRGGDADASTALAQTGTIGGQILVTTLSLDAGAQGGSVPADAAAGDVRNTAGIARGGTARLSGAGGAITAAGVSLAANAAGGSGTAAGGGASGGTAELVGAATFGIARLSLSGNALGGTSSAAGGGAGAAGAARIALTGGTLNVSESIAINAVGTGGTGGTSPGAAGGSGTGGAVELSTSGGAVVTTTPALTLDGRGVGGVGNGGGSAGGGRGVVRASGGAIRIGGALNVDVGAGGGGTRSGAAGSAKGGTIDVVVAADGATPGELRTSSLSLVAGGTGGTRSSGTSQLTGGSGAGGTVTVSATGGTLAGGTGTTIDVSGRGGRGFGFRGGAGQGGTATVTNAAGTLDLGNLSIDASGYGGGIIEVGYGSSPLGGDGGSGSGGVVLVDASGGQIRAGSVSLRAVGSGGDGQTSGGNGNGAGGSGGAATGGSVTMRAGGGGGVSTRFVQADVSAAAGDGADGDVGGNGGSATAGTAAMAVAQGGTFSSTGLYVATTAVGGDGGSAISRLGGMGNGGAGGTGGAATGGIVRFTADGGALPLTTVNLFTAAIGGAGGDGARGGRGGAGGRGGDATGSTVAIAALNGGTLSIDGGEGAGSILFLDNYARAGSGGSGGDGTQFGDTGGVGGSGGNALGGLIDVSAAGGTVTLGAIDFSASADGGSARPGGTGAPQPSGPGVTAAYGVAGGGAGGTIRFTARDVAGQPAGVITVGTAQLSAIGQAGTDANGYGAGGLTGHIAILNERSGADGGAIRFGQTNVWTVGQDDGTPALDVLAGNGEVSFEQLDAQVAGSIRLRAVGAASILSAKSVNLQADGVISATHAQPSAGPVPTLRASSVSMTSSTGIDLQPGSRIVADSRIALTSFGFTNADALFAGNRIDINSLGNVRVGTAIADAPAFDGESVVEGGRVVIVAGSAGQFDFVPQPLADASITVTGLVSGAASAELTAGRDVIVEAGGEVRSANLVTIDAGDDILIRSGGRVSGATDPLFAFDPEFETGIADAGVRLTAGRQQVGYDKPAGEVASILIDGAVSAGSRALVIGAGAVRASQPLAARSLIVSIDNAPVGDAVPQDDGGQLSGDCLEGSVCLDRVLTARTLLIGGLSGDGELPTRVRIAGGFDNRQTVIRTRGDLTLAGNDSYGGSELFRLQSLEGRVSAGAGAVLRGGGVAIDGGEGRPGGFTILAAQGIEAAGATFDSTDDLGLFVGTGDLRVGTLRTAGRVNTLAEDGSVRLAGQIDVPGAVVIDTLLSVGAGDAIVTANGGDARVARAETANGSAVRIRATQTAALGSAGGSGSDPQEIRVDGRTVEAGGLTAAGAIALTASDGAVTAGPLRARSGDVRLNATGLVQAAAVEAGGTVLVRGASADLGTLTGGTVDVATAGALTSGAVQAGGAVTLIAEAGPVRSGALSGGLTVTVESRAGSATLGDVTAGTGAALAARGGDLTVGTVRTRSGDARLEASGGVRGGGLAVAGSAIVMAGGALALDGATSAGGAMALTAESIALRGGVSAGSLDATAQNGLTFTTVDTAGAASMTSRGGNLTGSRVTSGGPVTLAAGGAMTLDRVVGGGDVSLTAGGDLLVREDLRAGGVARASGGSVTLNAGGPLTLASLVATRGDATVNATGDLAISGARAGGSILLASSGGAVTLADASTEPAGTGAARGDIRVTAATDATLSGNVAARDDLVVSAGRVARLNGQALGRTVSIASADVAIGTAARIGRGADTAEVRFINSGSGMTAIGSGVTGSYALETAELQTVAAQTLRVTAPGEIAIGSATLTGSAGSSAARLYGGNAALIVETPGRIAVSGALVLASAGANDLLSLAAGTRLDITAPGASLDAGSGRLLLAGQSIFAGTPGAAADVTAAAGTDARDARLGQADFQVPGGYLRANAIEFRFGSGLFVQNSGTAGDLGSAARAGFVANSVTLTALQAGATVVVNGRVADAGGAAVIPRLTIRGQGTQAALLDPRSTANGCLIAGGGCRFDAVDTPFVQPPLFPVQDTIGEALNPVDDPVTGGLIRIVEPLIQTGEFTGYGFAPPIDEPVTSTGNDDLWTGEPNNCVAGSGDPRCPIPTEGVTP